MLHTPERIGRELASPSRGRPAFGKRQPAPSRTRDDVRLFARDLGESIRRRDHARLARRVVMVGVAAMAIAFASPFLYSVVNTVHLANVELDAVVMDDLANFVTAAGDRAHQETAR